MSKLWKYLPFNSKIPIQESIAQIESDIKNSNSLLYPDLD